MSMTDELLGADRAADLADILSAARGGPVLSTRSLARALDGSTLSGRARALAGTILEDIDGDSAHLTGIMREAMADPSFTGWMLWPAGLAISWRAVAEDSHAAFDDAMAMLRELTPRMTSEFSIRPLLRHDLPRALGQLADWTTDPDWNVRRLTTEGSRPLLPWSERVPGLVEDPSLTRSLLDSLHADPEESVRRSVANHVNDHSRAHPVFAVETVRGWQSSGTGAARTSAHALRTLVKRGDPDALALLGFPPAKIETSPLELSDPVLPLGGSIDFRAEIENVGESPCRLVIDYVLTFPGARGGERTKVFKIAQRSLAPGERTSVQGSHSFRAITTRTYYPGNHALALQINGVVQPQAEFRIEDRSARPTVRSAVRERSSARLPERPRSDARMPAR